MNLTDHNCSGCLKYFKYKDLTIVLDPKTESEYRFCEKDLIKFKEMTKDSKVAVELNRDGTILYCYRCELKTKDHEEFMKHDCIKVNHSRKFLSSMQDHNEETN